MKTTTYLPIVKKTIAALMVLATSAISFGQANSSFLNNSPLIHSYSHGALANRNQFNNNVGASGVIRTQLSWQNAADLDLRFLLPQGVGSYVGSGFETFPIKNTLFLDTPDRHVWAGQKTVGFSNGQAQSSLDIDVRDGIANAPGGQRIENNYLSGNIPSGTYSFAVENYDNSHYYRNNPSAPATNFNFAVTLSGNGYIIPDNTLPLIAETGYAFGATGSIKDVGAIPTSASPIYSFNFFNPGLDSTHASGIDFFKRFNGNFLPGAYLAMLNVPGMNPAQAPSMVDAMHRMMNGQKNQFDSLSVLTNMGEGRLQKEFVKHFATPDSKHNTAQYIDPKTGQAVTVARNDFIKAMWAMNENKALKQQGDAFMASLPEQTRRDFQAIQNLHGNQHTATELRTADNNFLNNGQVANSVNSTALRALHSQDAQIAKGIFNDMVAGRTTTNAGALFDKKQVMGYDGTLTDVAYVRNRNGQVLQVTEGQLGTIAGQAKQQIAYNNYVAQQAKLAEQNRLAALAQQKQDQGCVLIDGFCFNQATFKKLPKEVQNKIIVDAYLKDQNKIDCGGSIACELAFNTELKKPTPEEFDEFVAREKAKLTGFARNVGYSALTGIPKAVTSGIAFLYDISPITYLDNKFNNGQSDVGRDWLVEQGNKSKVYLDSKVISFDTRYDPNSFGAGIGDFFAPLPTGGFIAGVFRKITKMDGAESALINANYAQKTFSQNFSNGGLFAGKTVEELALNIKRREIDVQDIPIDFIVRDGRALILNTRSAKALELAGIPRNQWNAINKTGNAASESRLDAQLNSNNLDSHGFLNPTMNNNK